MRKYISKFVRRLNPRSFSNNRQKALYRLLTAKGDGWVRLNDFRVPSAGSRIRDLRKNDFGAFDVRCRSAADLGREGGTHTFYYRLAQRNLTLEKIRNVFEIEV